MRRFSSLILAPPLLERRTRSSSSRTCSRVKPSSKTGAGGCVAASAELVGAGVVGAGVVDDDCVAESGQAIFGSGGSMTNWMGASYRFAGGRSSEEHGAPVSECT